MLLQIVVAATHKVNFTVFVGTTKWLLVNYLHIYCSSMAASEVRAQNRFDPFKNSVRIKKKKTNSVRHAKDEREETRQSAK